jgi:hypothetical protein
LTGIGTFAFTNCSSLVSIELPAALTSIDGGVFSGCISLTSVICGALTPPGLGLAYGYTFPPGTTIRVPAASVNAYKTAAHWSDYADQISAIN